MTLPNLKPGDKALITTDCWFYAPDGRSYRAVFGTIKAVRSSEDTLGVRTNAKSTNWYVEIGSMTLAGCQIHYAIRTDHPELGDVSDQHAADGVVRDFVRASHIWNADA